MKTNVGFDVSRVLQFSCSFLGHGRVPSTNLGRIIQRDYNIIGSKLLQKLSEVVRLSNSLFYKVYYF